MAERQPVASTSSASQVPSLRKPDKPKRLTSAEEVLSHIFHDDSDCDISENEDDDYVLPAVPEDGGDDSDSTLSYENEDSNSVSAVVSPEVQSREIWKSCNFSPVVLDFCGQTTDDIRQSWSPTDYVKQYVPEELFARISECTNIMSQIRTGTNMNTSTTEIYNFFGASIMMSCIPYPRINMYWKRNLRISAITDRMTRTRYFNIRSNLKCVVDNDITDEEKKLNRFWKVDPFLSAVRNGCLQLDRCESVSIDEQMIPFSGQCPYKQYVPCKPNPVGLKNFVLAKPSGLILDFEIYQGLDAICEKTAVNKELGLGAAVVARLVTTLQAGCKIYVDRFFTSIKIANYLLQKDMYLTGTVMKNRIKTPLKKLPDDKVLKERGRGSSACVVSNNSLCVLKWFDNKSVLFLSAIHGEQPTDTCSRWSKKDKDYITISRPSVVREYNAKMGGVDMADRMISYYRMGVRTKKWTIRLIMHLCDMALVNSWLQYRQDSMEANIPRKDILPFLDFRIVVAEVFLAMDVDNTRKSSESSDDNDDEPPSKRRHITPIPHRSVRSVSARHLPEMVNLKNPNRCRLAGCSGKSRVRCMECNMFLCLQSERNCFAAFHSS